MASSVMQENTNFEFKFEFKFKSINIGQLNVL
jgi:hypothetical protein